MEWLCFGRVWWNIWLSMLQRGMEVWCRDRGKGGCLHIYACCCSVFQLGRLDLSFPPCLPTCKFVKYVWIVFRLRIYQVILCDSITKTFMFIKMSGTFCSNIHFCTIVQIHIICTYIKGTLITMSL